MLFKKKTINSVLMKVSKKLFKNKAVLKHDDVHVSKMPNFLKLNVNGGADLSLRKKSFYFENNVNVDTIVWKIEQEYNLSFTLENELREKLENILKSEYVFTPENAQNNILEILEIAKKLKIDKSNVVEFVGKIMEKNEIDLRNEKHLKILHFNIVTEIERMDKLKNRIDQIASRRVTFYLMILATMLIAQTALFYNMIFYVDHLGWDLVEPATFLFGSIVFMLGIFSYVKLHKNAISGESIFQEFKRNILLRRYIRDNFNIEKYNSLNTQVGIVRRLLNDSKKI